MMNIVDKATQTQLANIEKRSGKTLAQLTDFIQNSGLTKHSEIRDKLISSFKLGYGDAAVLTGYALKALNPAKENHDSLSLKEIESGFYSGPKAPLRAIHDKIMAEIAKFGEFEIAPKKTYLSLRRKRQFAMVGPATNTRVDVGLNMKGEMATDRLIELPPGGMCQYQVRLTSEKEVDPELIAWIKKAYNSAD
jgi:hypothetical protein